VVQNGRARLRAVDVETRNSSDVWLRRGLEPGDAVIVYPPPELRDGARVTLRTP